MKDVRDALYVARNTDGKLVRRPMSPHLQIWRWPIAMAVSICHRVTGVGLGIGTLLLTWWLVAAATSDSAFNTVQWFLGTPIGMFVLFFDWNVSLIAGWFTLAFMVLPVIITASEESLKSVPKGFREGSLALGATKWQTIQTNVLPYALPGILTSSILGIARVAGETAPIMFTAAYVIRDKLPWDVDRFGDFFFQGVMALPYHIYVVASKIPQNEYTRDVQYGTAFVFLFTVAAIAMTAVILRQRLRKKYKW